MRTKTLLLSFKMDLTDYRV